MWFTPITALVLLLPAALSAPSPLRGVTRVAGPKKLNGYIVTLKDGAQSDDLVAQLGPAVTAVWSPRILNGFAGTFNDSALSIIRASPDVLSVTETAAGEVPDFVVEDPSTAVRRALVTRTDSPWGLQRISSAAPIGDPDPWTPKYTFRYDSTAQGEGVDAYVIDTGINLAHVEFEGRASYGATFGPYNGLAEDLLGHGTHVAGIIGGATHGVAKKVKLISVQVFGSENVLNFDDAISALDWVAGQVAITGRPSIVNLSVQGGGYTPLDNAITAVVNLGIHVVSCAGNYNVDVSGVSPARAPGGIAVGAMTSEDIKADFSNYGAGVTLWAPGHFIRSASIYGTESMAFLSGTSMAAPHAVGVMAGIISSSGNMSPAAMKAYLQTTAISGVLGDIPSGTPNLLLNNGFLA